MTIKLGKITLTHVQQLLVDDGRFMVEHHATGQSSSVFQDMGRRPVTVLVEGTLFGKDATSHVESLRESHLKMAALAFAADAAIGVEFTDVVIEQLHVEQMAGYASRYFYHLRLKEYTEPPANPGLGAGLVNSAAGAAGGGWFSGALKAVGALQNPGALGKMLMEDPSVLEHLNMGEVGQAMMSKMEEVSGADLGNTLKMVKDMDPKAMGEMLKAIKDGDGLKAVGDKLWEAGVSAVETMTGVDVEEATELAESLAAAPEILKELREIGQALVRLVEEAQKVNVKAVFEG